VERLCVTARARSFDSLTAAESEHLEHCFDCLCLLEAIATILRMNARVSKN
jgi:hypothetical protein